MTSKEFDYTAIGPYRDEEVKGVLEELNKSPAFLRLAQFMGVDTSPKGLEALLESIDSVDAFQERISKKWIKHLLRQSTTEITHEGIADLDTSRHYLYISNHRDIALDSAILNVLFHDHGIQTVQTAIGDNLLKFPIVKKLAKLNKNFTVIRSAVSREMYWHSKVLSYYIREQITSGVSSIWIAQREGRAKDGNDRTQQGVVKMLNMSNEDSFEAGCRALHIRPLSLSYEYDPCDRFKVRELLARERGETYVKEEEEDFQNIVAGFLGEKGRIHLSLQPVLDAELNELEQLPTLNEKIGKLTDLIDRAVYRGYQLFENNYIAYDLLAGSERWREQYSHGQRKAFQEYVGEICQGLAPAARIILLRKYAYPLVNKFRHAEGKRNIQLPGLPLIPSSGKQG